MIGFTRGFEAKKFFFDRPAILSAADRGTIRALSKFGAYVRRRSRSSLRVRKRVSDPGQPPSIHSRTEPNLRTILFSYVPESRSVVIGPVRLNQVDRDAALQPARGLVPELLEYGGTMHVHEEQLSGGIWVRRDQRRRSRNFRPQRMRRVQVAARPFMGPAFAKELPAAAGYFQGQIRQED